VNNTYISAAAGTSSSRMTASRPSAPAGPFAKGSASALARHTKMEVAQIAEVSMEIAGEICIYTNDKVTYEELG